MGSSRTGMNTLRIPGGGKEGEGVPGLPGGRGAWRGQLGRALPAGKPPARLRVCSSLGRKGKKGTAKHGRGRQLRLPPAPDSSLCFKE